MLTDSAALLFIFKLVPAIILVLLLASEIIIAYVNRAKIFRFVAERGKDIFREYKYKRDSRPPKSPKPPKTPKQPKPEKQKRGMKKKNNVSAADDSKSPNASDPADIDSITSGGAALDKDKQHDTTSLV